MNSVNSQVKAAEIANEGITAEYESGLGRSTLDVIQSNSILLNSRIALANSERNYLLAQFNVLKSIGLLNSSHLKLGNKANFPHKKLTIENKNKMCTFNTRFEH